MLSRKTLTPASTSLPIISAESVAGPRVETILVRRRVPLCMGRILAGGGAKKKSFHEGAPGRTLSRLGLAKAKPLLKRDGNTGLRRRDQNPITGLENL